MSIYDELGKRIAYHSSTARELYLQRVETCAQEGHQWHEIMIEHDLGGHECSRCWDFDEHTRTIESDGPDGPTVAFCEVCGQDMTATLPDCQGSAEQYDEAESLADLYGKIERESDL